MRGTSRPMKDKKEIKFLLLKWGGYDIEKRFKLEREVKGKSEGEDRKRDRVLPNIFEKVKFKIKNLFPFNFK